MEAAAPRAVFERCLLTNQTTHPLLPGNDVTCGYCSFTIIHKKTDPERHSVVSQLVVRPIQEHLRHSSASVFAQTGDTTQKHGVNNVIQVILASGHLRYVY